MYFIRIVFILLSLTLFSQSKIPETKKELQLLNDQASDHLFDYKYELSLAKARLALDLGFKLNDFVSVAKAYNTIAGNYEELDEYKKAIFYYKKGLVYANKTENDTVKYWLYNNIANVYCFEDKQFNKGVFYYKRSLEYSQRESDFKQVYKTNLNLTWAYFDDGKFKEGKEYLDFLNENKEEFGNASNLVIINMLNGMYYNHLANFRKAESYFLEALKLGKSGNERSDYSYAVEQYTKFLFDRGSYKEAYKNLSLYHNIRKELENTAGFSRAHTAGVNLEIDEYKRKIDKIESENYFQSQVLEKTKTISTLLIISLITLLLLIYSLYRNYNFKKVKNLELTQKNKELELSKEKAEVASKLKSQFVSTITHELRTPLYGVIGITDMLVDEHKDLADSPHLKSLKFSAKYLLALVNDVLQINKIEENRIVLEKMTFNLNDEMEFIINSLSFLAKKQNNKMNVVIDPNIPEFLIGDKLRLSQIVINLISNALKFTNNGTVTISANLIDVKDKTNVIKFTITDDGVGIAEENQQKIFDKFVQVGRKEVDYQGTGLGLSIVKQLLGLFNSTIHLKSELGKGTTFNFTIAFESDLKKTNAIISAINVDLTSRQFLKILIVDDNKINLLITQRTIEKFNYQCSTALSGEEALKILDSETFDVILMDINMPILNGFETTKLIRQNGIKTAVIALTAFDKEEVTEEAISAGFDDIISKPFDVKQLYRVINEVAHKELV